MYTRMIRLLMLIDIKIIVNNLLSSEIINGTTMSGKVTSSDQLRTVPFDPRFPNQNQTRNCYQNFLDYHRCVKIRGEKYEACNHFKKVFNALCPSEWTEKWTEEIEEGRFPGVI